jgi:hypothetical protein
MPDIMDEDEKKSGWVCLWRKSLKSTAWQDETVWRVWCWCLIKANRKDSEIKFNGTDVIIKRGQFITGKIKALAEMPNLSEWKWRNSLKYLKSTQRIDIKTTSKNTLITVCNYEDYQTKDTNHQTPKVTNTKNQPRTNQEPTTPYNNNNNDSTMINNFSEKVNFEFLKFLNDQKKSASQSRIKILAEKLETLAPGDDTLKIEIIKQAIAGGYSDFRPMVGRDNKRNDKRTNDYWNTENTIPKKPGYHATDF